MLSSFLKHTQELLKKFFFKSYISASIAQSVGAFVSIALLSRLLSPSEFGRWVLLEPLVLIGSQIAIFGANHGLIKAVAQDKVEPIDAILLFFNHIRWYFYFIIVIAGGGSFIAYSRSWWSIAIGFWLATEGILSLILSSIRGSNNPFVYAKGVFIRMGLILFGLMFLWVTDKGEILSPEIAALWWGISSLSACIFLLIIIRAKKYMPRTSIAPESMRLGITYGFPILIASILAAVIANGDRYILASYADSTMVGYYVIFVKIASALNFIVAPISLWWPTARFIHLDDDDRGQAFFSKVALQLMTLYTFVGGALVISTPILLAWIAPTTPASLPIVSLLVVACIATAMTTPLNIGLLKLGYTKYIPIILGFTAILHISISILLTKKYGMTGAAAAVAIASIISLIIQSYISKKIHSISFDFYKYFFCAIWFSLGALASLKSFDIFYMQAIMYTGLGIVYFSLNKSQLLFSIEKSK